ncbi:MAG: hypothetical protein ACKPJJ_02535, partial [Planctomycetaceae bacterium]
GSCVTGTDVLVVGAGVSAVAVAEPTAVSVDSSCVRAAFSETALLFRCWIDWQPAEQASRNGSNRRMAGFLSVAC